MELFITDDGKYRIESLSPTTFPGALGVIRDAFCQDEYVSIGAEVNKNPKAAEELLELCADAALDGVSLVAVEVNTGEVVSVSFNKIQIQTTDASEKPFFEIFAEERCTQASSRSLIQFMANVDARCNFFEKFGVDCSLELMFLATLREHRKQKLATLLSKYSIDVANKVKDGPFAPIEVKDLGPKYSHLQPRKPTETYPKICQAIWTSEGSQRIGKVLNFTVHLTVPLSEFVFDGKTYSERIGDDSAFCEVAALIL
ncbi:uncharacterized protein LOC123867928 [Maniola jurtina]|uniref:uncharacterized protein LOC123867928 n=1 Tax=Maniola jurtina TaxID=191418 RepID=UPI001E68DBCF|nr:uncharacterized protein LOC123867928 [Maniola jurtina]